MSRTSRWLFALVALVLTNIAAYASIFSHSSMCEAVTIQQAEGLQWRRDGLINVGTEKSAWVSCPVRTDYKNTAFVVFATNTGERAATLDCFLQEAGQEVQPQQMSLEAGQTNDMHWFSNNHGVFGNTLIVCKLPPYIKLGGFEAWPLNS